MNKMSFLILQIRDKKEWSDGRYQELAVRSIVGFWVITLLFYILQLTM